MKVVIDIDEKLFNAVIEKTQSGYFGSDVWIAVANGTPLPKGHGDLVDRERLIQLCKDYTKADAIGLILARREDYLPTVIPADKGMCYECKYKTDTCQEGLHCIREYEGD